MRLEFRRDVWDKEQNKLVSLVSISDGDRYVAVDARALKSKYTVLHAIELMLGELERVTCDHQNTEHHASGDIHPRSLPYIECLDCGIEIDTEPLYPEDVTK